MKGFIILAIILALVATSSAATFNQAFKQLLEEKARLVKSSVNGEDYQPVLRAHGTGLTDG